MTDFINTGVTRPDRRAQPIFYVYVYWIDGEPFYIGKGCGNRYAAHFSEWQEGRTIMQRKMRKLLQENGHNIEVTFFIKGVDESTAFKWEAFLIKALGRRCDQSGPLCNLTWGGEGCVGIKHSEETREKHRQRQYAIWGERVRRLQAGSICWGGHGWTVMFGPQYIARCALFTDAERHRVEACKATNEGRFEEWLLKMNQDKESHRRMLRDERCRMKMTERKAERQAAKQIKQYAKRQAQQKIKSVEQKDRAEKIRRLQFGRVVHVKRNNNWQVYMGDKYLTTCKLFTEAEQARVDACKVLKETVGLTVFRCHLNPPSLQIL